VSETIRVLVNGARGRMGQTTVAAIADAADMELAAECDLGDDLSATIAASNAQVVVDFTTASSAGSNFEAVVRAGASPVMGTSGFDAAAVGRADALCDELGVAAVIAPNFALASILLARYAADAARFLPHVELLEMHHDRKEDSPSGTALKVAAVISENRSDVPRSPDSETVPGVRGGLVDDVRVHSVRLPGLLARMECIFGGPGETLSLRHDTLTRESFMPGVLLAVRSVRSLKGLVYGLEHLL
jgi:4-hydroxy-tetrahydrodipicolinate reductase